MYFFNGKKYILFCLCDVMTATGGLGEEKREQDPEGT